MDGISLTQFFVIFAIAFPLIWVYSLIDLLKSDRNDKVVWILVLIFLNVLGVILYWTLKNRKSPPSNPGPS